MRLAHLRSSSANIERTFSALRCIQGSWRMNLSVDTKIHVTRLKIADKETHPPVTPNLPPPPSVYHSVVLAEHALMVYSCVRPTILVLSPNSFFDRLRFCLWLEGKEQRPPSYILKTTCLTHKILLYLCSTVGVE